MHSNRPRLPGFFYGYIIVFCAFLTMMLTWGTIYTFGVFLKPMVTEFDWSMTVASGAYSVCIFISGLLGMATGRLTDIFGPRIVVTVCGFFLGLGFLLMSIINASWQLYLFYGVIIAIGASGCFVPTLSTVTRWFLKRRGIMAGITVAGIGIGTIIMPPLARWLISSYGWRTSYTMLGVIVLLPIILAAQFLRRDPGQIGLLPYGQNESEGESLNLTPGVLLRVAIHTRQFWILGIVYFNSILCVQTIIVHIVVHTTGLGISAASAVSLLSIIGGLSIVGRIALGIVADRIGGKLALTTSLILLSFALLWVISAGELWMLYLFAVFFGLGYGGAVALMSPVLAELFGQSSLGAILGIINFISMVGGTIGPVLGGIIFDISGSYQVAFLICTVLALVSVILTLMSKPIHKQISASYPS